MTRKIVSIVNGRPATDVAAGVLTSANPSWLDDAVAEVTLATGATFASACASATPWPLGRQRLHGRKPAASASARARWASPPVAATSRGR